MRIKVYLRLAPTTRGHRVVATTKPSYEPIRDVHGEALPTTAFAVNFDLPADVFKVPALPHPVAVPDGALSPIVEAVEVEVA